MTAYEHKQKAPMHLLLHSLGVALFVWTWFVRDSRAEALVLGGVGALIVLAAFMFSYMIVRDEGEFLAIRFGPIRAFQHQIRYAEITSVEPGKSAIIDGWGMHWIPGRGWTYNLWGFDCAVLKVGNKTVKVGSNDVENLVKFLRGRVG